jgi:hypothetical protein
MDAIIKFCVELEEKYGHLPFDKALPYFQEGWWKIGNEHGLTGPEVVQKYMDWKSKQLQK